MSKIGFGRTLVLATLTAIALTGSPGPGYAQNNRDDEPLLKFTPHCHPLTVPVALGPGLPVTDEVSGTLCLREENEHVVRADVLVPGATYTQTYWDWPLQPELYSYVRHALFAGRATFAFDPLGRGQSSKPASTLVTMEADAHALHLVIQHLISHHGMREVNVVGHSFGSMIAVLETALYHDADRLVLTGLQHSVGPGRGDYYPANLDPQFAGIGYDSGWLTTRPGTRGGVFYYLKTADPAVIAYDEAHKSVESQTQFVEGLAQTYTPAGENLSNQITVPVLEINGEFDLFACTGPTLDCSNEAAVHAFEVPYYTEAPILTTRIVANTGHDLNLHPTAPETYEIINAWLNSPHCPVCPLR